MRAIDGKKKLAVFLMMALFIILQNLASNILVSGQVITEDESIIHEYINDVRYGNRTFLDVPILPVYFNSSKISIGQNWTIICPLLANHSYHIYIYGNWINTTSTAITDYNVYVFDPQGKLESTHTEAAGFPEHLGTTTDDPFYVPQKSGNYTFLIVNDPKGSKGEQEATFMIIESVHCNMWYEKYIEGKTWNTKNTANTIWACEFFSNSSEIEVWIKVPSTLDMYESRLYAMNILPFETSSKQKENNTQLESLNGVPLPWEPGLYGEVDKNLGGYSFKSEAFRGVAYASCEFNGQDMYMNFTTNSSGLILYHLAFIGQTGFGDIEFLIKSKFDDGTLNPVSIPIRAECGKETLVSYTSNTTQLEKATLIYTNDAWKHSSSINMQIKNNTCSALIPTQEAGSVIIYKINATDNIQNVLQATGNFTVKNKPIFNISAVEEKVKLGDNITLRGFIKSADNRTQVTIHFMSANETQDIEITPNAIGEFNVSYCPNTKGDWTIQASTSETQTSYGATAMMAVNVYQTFFDENSFAIGGAAIGATTAALAFLVLKSRNR